MLDGVETEALLWQLYGLSRTLPFDVKTTEAPQYRRFVAQISGRPPPYDGIGAAFYPYRNARGPDGTAPHAF
jgi:hypothetical protein